MPSAISRAIDVATVAWRAPIRGVRWTSPEDRHVTLRFVGDVASADVEPISALVRSASRTTGGFTSTLGRVGGFPSVNRAHVVWMGLEDPAGAWIGLAANLDGALAGAFGSETRPFRPHITLGRTTHPVALPQPPPGAGDAPALPVANIVLFRSHLGGSHPRYEPLEIFPLPHAGGG